MFFIYTRASDLINIVVHLLNVFNSKLCTTNKLFFFFLLFLRHRKKTIHTSGKCHESFSSNSLSQYDHVGNKPVYLKFSHIENNEIYINSSRDLTKLHFTLLSFLLKTTTIQCGQIRSSMNFQHFKLNTQ